MYNVHRGEDATGLWTPKNGVVKSLDRASKFLNSEQFKAIEEDCSFIGHVRSGARYKTFMTAAHPHEGDNCVLAHNGTLSNTFQLASKYGILDNGTDTELLHKIIDTNWNPKVLTQIDGTATLLIGDKNVKLKKGQENSYLLAFRLNKERPLFFGTSEEGLYLSSLEDSLEAIGCTDIAEFDTNILYTIFEGKVISEFAIPERPLKTSYNSNNYSQNNSYNNTPAVNYTFTNNSDMSFWNKFLNNWIQTDTKGETDKGEVYEREEWFLLKGINITARELTVQKVDKTLLTIPVGKFYYTQRVKPLTGYIHEKVVIMTDITTKDPKLQVFHKGDVVSITRGECIIDNENCITCKSHVDLNTYPFKKEFARPCLENEKMLTNVLDNMKHVVFPKSVNVPKKEVDTEVNTNSRIEESHLAQYMVEQNLLKGSLKVQDCIDAVDLSKEVSAIFDICEDVFITVKDVIEEIEEHENDLDLKTVTSLSNSMGELKEKTCDIYIKTVELWKKKQNLLTM